MAESVEKPSSRGKWQDIAKTMEALGPCSSVVKNTMQKCFMMMSAGVKEALSEGGAGLIPTETEKIGEQGGNCFEEGLIKLGQC